MEKSRHVYKNFDIPYDELINFVDPVKVIGAISLSSLSKVCGGKDYGKVMAELNNINTSLVGQVPSLMEHLKDNEFRDMHKLSYITYNPHESGYDFRMNPISFVNKVYVYLGLDYSVPFINLDAPHGKEYFKDFVSGCTSDIRRKTLSTFKVNVASEINANLDSIIKYYDIDINPLMESIVIPKDFLFYLAIAELGEYERTHEEKFLILPYEYYHHVSHMRTSAYPHAIPMGNERIWYMDFRSEFEKNVPLGVIPDPRRYMVCNDEVFIAWDILEPGVVEREIRDVVSRAKSSPNVDYEKYQRLFEAKMNFYMSSPYVRYISGRYGLLGYMGFSYQNEYLLFDKFHNSQTIDPSKKTILTHEEAVFAFPSDRFDCACNDKQYILQAKESDIRIKKYNHTSNLSFLNKLDSIIKGPNVSLSTLDEEIENYKRKVLIKR